MIPSNERFEAEQAVLRDAAVVLAENERLRQQLRANEDRLRELCRKFDLASGSRGFATYHLRNACVARGLI